MKISNRRNQAGLTLLEYIVALVVASIIAAMVYTFFGSALTESGVPIERLRQVSNLQQVMENIVADYERLNQLNVRFKWRSGQGYAIGDIVSPSDGITGTSANNVTSQIGNNGRYYICTTAGISGSTVPSWAVTTNLTGTVSDGSVVWQEKGYVWKASTAYPANAIVVLMIGNGHFYKGPGTDFTSGADESTIWLTSPGETVCDGNIKSPCNGMTWTEVGTVLDRSNSSSTDAILIDSIKYYLDNNPARYGPGYTVVGAQTKFIKFSGTPPVEADATGTDERNLLKVTIKNANTAETLTKLFTIR